MTKHKPKHPKKGHVMNPAPLISIVNQSNRADDAALKLIAQALGVQMQHVAQIWGLTPAIEYVGRADPSNDAAPCFIIDKPEFDGALGYHDEDDNGVPYMKIFCDPVLDNGGTMLSGSNSISAVLSHEVCELIGDTSANWWADAADGTDYALELCDAVESDSYKIDSVSVSNFVYKAFFDPKAKGVRFDYLGNVDGAFKMTSGGYQIRRTEPGKITQVFASHGNNHVEYIHKGVAIEYGPSFPTWKKPYKRRKAHARSGYIPNEMQVSK